MAKANGKRIETKWNGMGRNELGGKRKWKECKQNETEAIIIMALP